MKRPKLLLRISSGLLGLVALSLTIAHAYRYDMADQAGRVVLDKMAQPLDFDGDTISYLRLYNGMTLNLIVMYAFLAVFLWMLSGRVLAQPAAMRGLLLAVGVFLGINSVLSFMYFFPPPGILQGIACLFCISVFNLMGPRIPSKMGIER